MSYSIMETLGINKKIVANQRLYYNQQQTSKNMYKSRANYSFSKKGPPQPESKDHQRRIQTYSTNYFTHNDTRESPFSKINQKQSLLQANSSRIAVQGEALCNNYQSFQESILKKVGDIESQSNKLLQKRQRQLYFLKTELQNCEIRLEQAQAEIKKKDERIVKLVDELQKSNEKNNEKSNKYFSIPASRDIQQLQQQNEKLKQSLRILIQQKNQNWRSISKQDKQSIFSYNKLNVHALKKQVQQLKAMVCQMQDTVNNCPGCYTLKRQNQQLAEAYDCLIKQHTQLSKAKSTHEKELLVNITAKIQQNQNILRENLHLKQGKQERPYIRRKGEKMKELIVKRCRTLTDQF